MDKTLFYAREKLLASDLNQTVTDTEAYGEDLINKWLSANNNVVLTGLLATGNTPPDNKLNISAGVAYHKDGRKVETANEEIIWSDTDPNALAAGPHLTLPRIDIVAVRHQSINTSTVTRYFIDVDPTSPTYGQSVPQTVVTEQNDSYQFYVAEGTPNATPTVPAINTDTYIPLYIIYIHSQAENSNPHIPAVADPTNAYIQQIAGTGWAWAGAWRADLSSDIDSYYYQDLRRKALTTLEDKTFEIPIDESVGAGSARADVSITPDWSVGDIVLNDTVDVRSNDIISVPTFFGTGLNDLSTSGDFSGTSFLNYRVEIDSIGATDTFRWSDDGGATWDASGVAITGAAQTLNNGIIVTFGAVTGHTLNDYWNFYADPSANQPVYGPDGQSDPIWENLIFGIVTDITPGSETVTFYRGNPQGTLGVDYWTSNCNVDITLTYPLNVKLHNLPEDVFRNQFQTGMIIDMNIEKRLEDIEDGTSGTTYFLRIDGTNEMLAPITFNSALAVPPFVVPASASGVVTNLNVDRLDSLHANNTGTSYIPYVNGSTKMVLGSAGSQIGVGVTPVYSIDVESNGTINVRGASGRVNTNTIGANTGTTVTVQNCDFHINPAATTNSLIIRPPTQGYVRIYPVNTDPTNQTGYYCYYRPDYANTYYGALTVDSVGVYLDSNKNGTGIVQPLTLMTAGNTALRIETNQQIRIGTGATSTRLFTVTGDAYFLDANNSVAGTAVDATLFSGSSYAGVNFSYGIWAESVADRGRGVYGRAISSGLSTDNIGVKGYGEGTGSKGVMGQTNNGYGVYGLCQTAGGRAVYGSAVNASSVGMFGRSDNDSEYGYWPGYGSSSGYFTGSVWTGQERAKCFVRIPQFQAVLSGGPVSSEWEELLDTDQNFPGYEVITHDGAIKFWWKSPLGSIDQHMFVYFPIYKATSSVLSITMSSDDELYYKLIKDDNTLYDAGMPFMHPMGAGYTLDIRNGAGNVAAGHYIIAMYVNNLGGGSAWGIKMDRWMTQNSCIYSPWILNKFLASTRTGALSDWWTWNKLGDGVI